VIAGKRVNNKGETSESEERTFMVFRGGRRRKKRGPGSLPLEVRER